jgi:hypothetical protein
VSLPDNVIVGRSYVFRYPAHFKTLPGYDAHRDQVVTVVRQCSDEEADQGEGMERMFVIRCGDWEGVAWASELEEIS